MSIIKNPSLAPSGHKKIAWVRANMPLLVALEEEYARSKPFLGLNVTVCVHLEAKTAYLSKVLAAGGAKVAVTGSNPLSTQDDVAAALAEDGLAVYGVHGVSDEEYTAHLKAALAFGPDYIVDDGGDLVALLHGELSHLLPRVKGGCEETTTGVHRLKARADSGSLAFPMIAVNDADCKHLFDNRYGTGQSVWDGINRTTNLIVAGKTVVVAGYGWCGKGVAMRAKGQGARVVVTEVDPVRAIEAVMDGFEVKTMAEAAPVGDFFITVTGCDDVINAAHFPLMKNGALLANAGHFDVEINLGDLAAVARPVGTLRDNITGYRLSDGRTLCVLAEGRLVNLAAGDGHPAEIMDMSFAIQALSLAYLVKNADTLEPGVHSVPRDVDEIVAHRKLESLGVTIDRLTEEQERYLHG